jgi:hypothetical protein
MENIIIEINSEPSIVSKDINDIDIKKEEETQNKKVDDCIELKNIKYKTMLMNGVPFKESISQSSDMTNLDAFLENEKNNNKNEPWCKLDKTIKTQKLMEFVELYKNEKKLDNEEEKLLVHFLKDCLDRKKLQRIKDVNYDKATGVVKEIPALTYVKINKHFTLRNVDKRVSTTKSLGPKKSQGTIKNKVSKND